MLNEDQYLERTTDLVARVRKLRKAAAAEMTRFTRVSDYDVRHVIGHGPRAVQVSCEILSPSRASGRLKKTAAKPVSAQAALEFTPAADERSNDREKA